MSQADTTPWGQMKLALRTMRDLAFLPRLRADKSHLDTIENSDELVNRICLRKRRKGIVRANQHPEEIGTLFKTVSERKPRVIVEIGTSKGGTLYLWSRAVAENGTLVSIDLPGGCGTVTSSHQAVYRTFGGERNIDTQTISLNSHSAPTHARLKEILAGRPIDFLFIDGDHSYEGVRCDFCEYSKYMADSGLIAMHDIAISESDPTIQVARFWKELKAAGHQVESIVSQPGKSPGIGVVSWRSDVSALLSAKRSA